MKYFNGRLLAGILVPLAIGGTLAGCGDDNDTTAGNANTGGPGAQTAAKPTASAAEVDKAFVRQMVPHHMMAVDMAELAQKGADHDEIKKLSAEIISAQNAEIKELEAIAETLGVTPDEPMGEGADMMSHGAMMKDAKTLGLSMRQMGMSMNMTALESADPFDKAFIDEMTIHHQGAIAMAKAQLAGGENAALKTIATAIITAQEKEAAEMAAWRAEWYPGAAPQADSPGGKTMPGLGHSS